VTKEILGEFEHHVLLAAVRLADSAYSAAIVQELERRTGREVSPAAVYIALRRLEDSGLVTSALRVGEDSARERRYFSATPEAVDLLRASRERYLRLWDGLEPMLGGGR
jgi:DNA-binding PadR family transcriptional regulator